MRQVSQKEGYQLSKKTFKILKRNQVSHNVWYAIINVNIQQAMYLRDLREVNMKMRFSNMCPKNTYKKH